MNAEHPEGVVELPPESPAFYPENRKHVQKARWLLLALAAFAIGTGIYYYVVNTQAFERDLRAAEQVWQGVDHETRDAELKAQTGMTWDEIITKSQRERWFQLGENILIAAGYAGCWWWARRNALRATATALALYLTVQVANAVYYDATTLYQGILIKLVFISILAKAITAAWEERKAQELMPQATAKIA